MVSSFLNAAGRLGRMITSERIEAAQRVLAWASRAAWRLDQA